jgi:hypothetical protein
MTERQLQNSLGIIIICSYVVTLLLLIVSGSMEWLTSDEYPAALYIVLPLLGAYVIGVARNITANRHQIEDTSRKVSDSFKMAVYFFTIIFNLFIIGLIAKESLAPGVPEKFLQMLALSETAFGAFLSIFLKALYPEMEIGQRGDAGKKNAGDPDQAVRESAGT